MIRFGLLSLVSLSLLAGSLHAQGTNVYAWGYNGSGELGNGSTTSSSTPAPVSAAGALPIGQTINAVGTGGSHSLAIANGTLYSWGSNSSGQLGTGNNTSSSVPVAVTGLAGKTVTAVAGGFAHTLAIANGSVYGWGFNGLGQLGNGTTSTTSTPTLAAGALAGLTVTAISTSDYTSLAVANGRAYSWGNNGSGQLGNGTNTTSYSPVAVDTTGVLAGKTVTAVASGQNFSLAVASGKAYAWGFNNYDTLGIGQSGATYNSNVPVAVSTAGVLNGRTVTGVAGGYAFALAVADGKVFGWGNNSSGELGNGTYNSSNVPVAVSSSVLNSLNTVKVAASASTSYALTDTGRLFVWGDNGYGLFGNGTTTGSALIPQEIMAPTGYIFSDISADELAGDHVVAAVVAVPESSLFALGLSFAAFAGYRRKRAASKATAVNAVTPPRSPSCPARR